MTNRPDSERAQAIQRVQPPSPLSRKICSRKRLAPIIRRLKQQKRRIVFTNGCFDLLHVGHVTLLERARRFGDILVVAINSDRSVRIVKGRTRPLVPQSARARVLAALACVDYVTMFDEPTPFRLLAVLKPDVLVKGADWGIREIVGRGLVEGWGGRVVQVPLVSGYSTSRLVERILRRVRPSRP